MTSQPRLPVQRAICINTASLVAQARVGRGVGPREVPVSAQVRKALLWAIAWCEGEEIVLSELAAISGLAPVSVNVVLHSLAVDGLIRIEQRRRSYPNRYWLVREALALRVVPTRFGAARPDGRQPRRRKRAQEVAPCP